MDGRRLRAAPVFSGIVQGLRLAGLKDRLPAWDEKCGLSPLEVIDELVVSQDNHPMITAALSVSGERALECMQRLTEGKALTFDGAHAVSFEDGKVAVIYRGLLLVGSEDTVRSAMAAGPSSSGLAQRLSLPAGAFLVAWGDQADGPFRTIAASARADAGEFAIDLRLDLSSAEVAEQARGKVQESLGRARDQAGTGMGRALDALSVRSEGSALIARLGFKGGPEQQAAGIGTAAAVAIAAVRRYLVQAKASEARSLVLMIASGLSEHIDEQKRLGKAVRFPPSAPMVPSSVPRGRKVVTAAADWEHPSWKAAHFSMTEPQYYAYEIVTASDRKSARIRAHGDLNADGKESSFEVQMELGRTGEVIIHSMQEIDPTE